MPRQPVPLRTSPTLARRTVLIEAVKAALRSGQAAKAQAMLAEPLARSPRDPALLTFGGLAHRALGDTLGALELLERAVAAAPDLVPARIALVETLVDTHRAPAALAALDGLPKDRKASHPVVLLRASALAAIGREKDAVALLRTASVAEPHSPPLRLRLGHALRALGQASAAAAEYRAILATDPGYAAAWWSIASLDSERFDQADVEAMTAALAAPGTSADSRIRIGFALARHAERNEAPADCFARYASANAGQRARTPFDVVRFRRERGAATDLFTQSFFAARPDHGTPSAAPIFIIGMQRSGSTLLEQMLGCHPAIETTAELPHLNQMWRELRREAHRAGRSVEDHIASLGAAQSRELGETYLDRAAAHRHTGRPHFIDKMPDNWRHAGLIALILPGARIIDLRRHPMATGWANFRQLYARGSAHSYALEDWATFFRAYVDLMEKLMLARPGLVHGERFENLVSNPDATLRRVCHFLDIPFDPAMLSYHRSARPVRTISAEQVRRPLDPTALDAWRRFDQWLGPLREALGGALDEWDGPAARND